MSLINDALKRARQNQPAPATPSQPALPAELKMAQPLQPVVNPPKPEISWLFPITVIFLIIAVAAIAGWAASHRSVRTVAAASPVPVKVETPVKTEVTPITTPAAQQVSTPVAVAAAIPEAVHAPVPVEPDPTPLINPPDAPKLQGILYEPGRSSAILDGRSVRAGDKFLQYRVKEISQSTVTLVDSKGKSIKLDLAN